MDRVVTQQTPPIDVPAAHPLAGQPGRDANKVEGSEFDPATGDRTPRNATQGDYGKARKRR